MARIAALSGRGSNCLGEWRGGCGICPDLFCMSMFLKGDEVACFDRHVDVCDSKGDSVEPPRGIGG
jgi:hypothetical protein